MNETSQPLPPLQHTEGESVKLSNSQRELFTRIRQIWESAQTQAVRSVNTAHVCANWLMGQQIVAAEQGGAKRAGYGQRPLKTLSAQLCSEYGSGFSVSALQYMRGFFLSYPQLLSKQHAVRVEFDANTKQHAVRGESGTAPARSRRTGAGK